MPFSTTGTDLTSIQVLKWLLHLSSILFPLGLLTFKVTCLLRKLAFISEIAPIFIHLQELVFENSNTFLLDFSKRANILGHPKLFSGLRLWDRGIVFSTASPPYDYFMANHSSGWTWYKVGDHLAMEIRRSKKLWLWKLCSWCSLF